MGSYDLLLSLMKKDDKIKEIDILKHLNLTIQYDNANNIEYIIINLRDIYSKGENIIDSFYIDNIIIPNIDRDRYPNINYVKGDDKIYIGCI